MNTKIIINKKDILSSPVTAFTTLYSEKWPDKKAQLELLWQQLCELKQQKQEKQLQTKKLSRQIGENKRNNQSIDTLKNSMQHLSQQQNQISQQLIELEQKILVFFETNNDSTKSDDPDNNRTNKSNDNLAGRRYTDVTDILNEVSITLLTNEHKEWNNYVEQHPAGCIHHRSEWKTLLNQSYGHECFYFIARNVSNSIVGLLPLVHLNSRLFGNMLISMPYFQRAGAIADNPHIEDKLIQAANQHAKKFGIEHIEYRDDIQRKNMPAQSHKVNMVLSLPSTDEDLFNSFSSKLRAQIKRPQRENPQIQIGREELLNDFYAVYARNMRDLGSPLHSKKFISKILEHFPENSWLIVISLKHKPVAAGFLLGFKDTMEIPLASTIRDVNGLSINMLLYWQVLQLAIKKGYQYFDFGRSTKGAGTYRFKKQWGAEAKPLFWHYWLSKDTELPGLNPSNPKYSLVINIWKRLPIKITQWIGPHIVKFIP